MNLRAWLMKAPRPSRVRAGDQVIVVGEGQWRWAELERSILSTHATAIAALDADGNVLRAVELEGDEAETADASSSSSSSSGRMGELAQLGKIIADAADRAAQRHAEAYEKAFQRQNEIVDLAFQRLEGLERAWMRAIEERERRVVDSEAAGGADGVTEELVGGLVRSAFSAEKPNGKPKPTTTTEGGPGPAKA